MDRSRYTQKVNMAQMQADLPEAVINADKLLHDFEMEVLNKLRQKVQVTVDDVAQMSEVRLNKTLAENCAREYKQLQEILTREYSYTISTLESRMLERQRQLERRLLIVTIGCILLSVVMILLFVLWFVIKH